MDTNGNILLLDHDENSAQEIQRFLKAGPHAFSLSHAPGADEGLNYMKQRRPDLILMDSSITGDNNFPALKKWVQQENIPLILLSEANREDSSKQIELSGADEYLVKNKLNLFNLQKIIQHILKINATEEKLDKTVSHLNTRHDALFKVLNKINAGVLVLNRNNSILYANTQFYALLSDEPVRDLLSTYLNYRELDEEESIQLKAGRKFSIEIKTSETEWNGEPANLFLMEKKKAAPEETSEFLSGEWFQTLMNSTRGNVILLRDNSILFSNKAALKTLGFKASETLQQTLKTFFELNSPDAPLSTIHSILSDRESEGLMKMKGGGVRRIKYLIKPVQIGGEIHQLLSFEPIADEQNNMVPQGSSDKSKFSNDNILHLASHDLREPVRTILNYIQLVSDNLQRNKYEEASEYAGFAKDAAGRMEQLLSDLKIYIGLNDYQFTLSKLSMKSMTGEVLKKLKNVISESGAEINIAELPDVHGDRELVQMLLYHLLDNALKFRKKDRKPVVDIGYDKFEGNVIFCVRDNGIGISKKYYRQIFESFERLNRVDEYTGNGLGLAICKRIVEMHGGEIWVESLPGAGSNFYFTLKGKQ